MIQYLFGDDTFTARKKIHEQAETLKARIRWVDKDDVETESLEQLFDASRGSLLGSVVVVIQDPSQYSEEVRERILVSCETFSAGNILLWDRSVDKRLTFHKKMKQLASSQETSSPISEDAMLKWTSLYAPDLSSPIVRELVARVGCDIWAMVGEIEKVRLLPAPVQVSDVQRVVAQREMGYSSAFPLLDAIVRKQSIVAVRMLSEMLESGASERFILAMLAYQFRLFLSIRMGKDAHETISTIHEKTGLHSIAIQKGMAMASRLPVDTISELLARIAATEKSLNTTTMDEKSIVTMLVIGLCR